MFMVCWLATLAQKYPDLIKTDDSFRLIQTADPYEFNQIKVAIANGGMSERLESGGNGKLSFSVTIHSIAYRQTRFNKWWIRWSDWKSRFTKTPIDDREINQTLYDSNIKDAETPSPSNRFKPALELICRPIKLSYKLEDYLPCGIAKFSISLDSESDFELDEILELFGRDIFDSIHLYFHNHHFHVNAFAYNDPIYSDASINIHDNNNEAIAHFINKMSEGLSEMVNELYLTYKDFHDIDKHPREKGKKRLSRRKRNDSIRKFYDNCDNLFGMHSFLNAILCAPQNTHWKMGRDAANNIEKERIETAVLIENTRRGTEALMQKISHHEDDKHFSRSMRWAFVGIWVSVVMGLLGILMSIDSIKNFVNGLFE